MKNNNLKNLTLLFFCLFQITINAQIIEWSNSFGGSRDDSGYRMNETNDGGYIVIGNSESIDGDLNGNNGPAGTRDIWVVKINSNGNMDWQKNFGGSENEAGRSIVQTSDGGYIFTGATMSNDGDVDSHVGSNDIWVVKIDTNGNIEWQKTLGGLSWDFGESIRQTSDDGYIVVGISSISQTSDLDYIIYKLNALGEIQWQKRIGGSEDEYSTAIEQTSDLGFIIAGRSRSNDGDVSGNNGKYDCWIVKLSLEGDIVWEKNYGGNEDETANSIKQTPDGGYIVVGRSASNDIDLEENYGSSDFWVFKISDIGTIEWQNNFGGSSYNSGTGVVINDMGEYFIIGTSSSDDFDVDGNYGDGDFWMLKLTREGELIYEKNFGGSSTEFGYSIFHHEEDKYVIAGLSASNDNDITDHIGQRDLWIALVDESFITTSNQELLKQNLNVYPNPISGRFLKVQDIKLPSISKYSIYNDLGQLIKKGTLNQYGIDVSKMLNGVYWLSIENENQVQTMKFIVQ